MNTISGSLTTIIHSTDGGVDDFATTALIAAAQKNSSFDFSAVVITNADCEPVSALAAYEKTMSLLESSTKVGLSTSRVWNQFPWVWRMDSEAVNQLPCLQHAKIPSPSSRVDGDTLLVDSLRTAEKVKIIATGPLTSISDALKKHPELASKISEIHWMGGAIDVPGNILESPELPKTLLNDAAEWNVFADPESADWIFKNTSIGMHIYPIDLSNSTIPADFLDVLKKQPETIYSKFVKDCYQIVEKAELYRMWDVVAAAGVFFPEIFNPPVKEKISVEITGQKEGALVRKESGREVFVYKEFKNQDPNLFYEAVAKTLTN